MTVRVTCAHLGDIRDQALEAEQCLRNSLNTRARLLMHVLVGDKGTDNANPVGWGRGRGLLDARGHLDLTPTPAWPGRPSQQHEGGQQQKGHEQAALTGHLLVLHLRSAPTAPMAAATIETKSSSGHQQEVEARDDSAHHVARLVPHHLHRVARQGGGADPQADWAPERNQKQGMHMAGTVTYVLELVGGTCVTVVYHLENGESALQGGHNSLQHLPLPTPHSVTPGAQRDSQDHTLGYSQPGTLS